MFHFKQHLNACTLRAATCCPVHVNSCRLGSNFINSKTAAQLWQSVTPHDQKPHTGGKRLIRRAVKDLNFGRPVGTGKLGIQWPGLNAPVKIAHYNEKMQKAYEGGSDEVPLPGSHGLTKSWMQSESAARKLVFSKRAINADELSETSRSDQSPPRNRNDAGDQKGYRGFVKTGAGRNSREFSTLCSSKRDIDFVNIVNVIYSKREFSTLCSSSGNLNLINDVNITDLRSFSSQGGSNTGVSGGGVRSPASRFNTVRIDQALGSIKTMREKQAEKFDAAEKRIKKRSYNAPLSIRGWTSKSLGGLSVGAPSPKGVVDYEGFQTKILEVKRVCTMKGRFGRVYKKWVLVACGNQNGLIGYAFARADQLTQAVRIAKNNASKKLIFVERHNNNTIYTDSTVDMDRTTVHMRRVMPGHGLRCSRVIREICLLAGISDLRAKIEGPNNTLKVVMATFEILANQKPYQEQADEKKLNVVKFREDAPFYPILLASPQDGQTRPGSNLPAEGELTYDELDQTIYAFEHRLDKKEKVKRFYGIEPSFSPFRRPGKLYVPELRKASRTILDKL